MIVSTCVFNSANRSVFEYCCTLPILGDQCLDRASLSRPGCRRHPGHPHLPVLATRTVGTRTRVRRILATSGALAAPDVHPERGGQSCYWSSRRLHLGGSATGRRSVQPGRPVAPGIGTGACPTGANSKRCSTARSIPPLFQWRTPDGFGVLGRIVTRATRGMWILVPARPAI